MLCVVLDTAEADALAKSVDEACSLLASYNSRLAEELLERKRIAKMLRNFIASQKEALVESEKKYQVGFLKQISDRCAFKQQDDLT